MKINRRQLVRICGFAMVMLGLVTVAFAHHSQSQFDLSKQVTIEGTLAQIGWSNPHSLFYINAKRTDDPGGAVERWVVEGPSPLQLVAAGWQKTAANVGDKVTMVGAPRRDGQRQLLLQGVVLADGKKFLFKNDPTGGGAAGN
jgi:uncharacterized protein DUF6152